MSNFDFDKYKNSYDKVTVSDERKEEIIALMKKKIILLITLLNHKVKIKLLPLKEQLYL